MSHGPSITVYDLDEQKLREKSNEILDLFIQSEIGTKKEKEYVCNYITNMLIAKTDKKDSYMFAFWNHRDGQEVEDYDVLCDLFDEYGKILTYITMSFCVVIADYREYTLFCRDFHSYKILDSQREDLGDYINVFKLKSDVKKGTHAEKELKKLSTKVE